MKKKKGFTLVELIAVIAILAIILLLIVPNIVDMFNNGKKDAFVRQVQSVWKQAEKEYATNLATGQKSSVYSDKNTGSGRVLSLNKTDITYITGFDSHGEVTFIAVGDKNYCYIGTNPESMEIPREAVVEGTLTCVNGECTCGDFTASVDLSGATTGDEGGSSGGGNSTGSTSYVYWSTPEGGYNVTYGANSKPAVTYSNYLDALSKDPDKMIRTTLDSNGNVIKHEACLYHNYRLFCLGAGYWENNSYDTKSKLQSDMEGTLHDVAYNCYNGSSVTDCVFGCGCRAYESGIVACYDEDDFCTVYSDGTAFCN